jgi:hypothetical protein
VETRKLLRVLPLFSFLFFSSSAWSDELLLKELKALRASLPAGDPSASELELRMADLHFDVALELTKKIDSTASDQALAHHHRLQALALYEASRVDGLLGVKVTFQRAKILEDLSRSSEAHPLWITLSDQKLDLEIAREAVLKRADHAEERAQFALAQTLYLRALELCAGGDLCSYVRYRSAWVAKRQGDLSVALTEMRQALWDSRQQIREEALRDFIVFHAAVPGDGSSALQEIDALAQKTGRSALVAELADASFAAGNKRAGVLALTLAHQRSPRASSGFRLLEERYGLREWGAFRVLLEELLASKLPLQDETRPESEKISKRLTLQLDGERLSDPSRVQDFQRAVDLHLKYFPKAAETRKFIEGWCAAETDVQRKLEKASEWLSSTSLSLGTDDRLWLHQMRGSIAQKLGRASDIVVEMDQILALGGVAEKVQRQSRYHRARALYELKDQRALEALSSLAQVSAEPDSLAIQSLHLSLDLLGQQKNYSEMIARTEVWLQHPEFARSKAYVKDLQELRTITAQARFELAASSQDEGQALAQFKEFCLKGEFRPKSCENAKALSVKLSRRSDLLQIIEAVGSPEELLAELEVSGRFAEAARRIDVTPKSKPSSVQDVLKIALFYELGDQTKERDRTLQRLSQAADFSRQFGASEETILEFLSDADLLSSSHLSWSWSPQARAKVADRLEQRKKGNSHTRALLLKNDFSSGPSWSRITLEEVRSLSEAQSKIQFTGRNSKALFERRLKALEKLTRFGETKLARSDWNTRVGILQVLERSTQGLALEILQSPLPEGLDPEAITQIRESLASMAAQFEQKSKEFSTLAHQQFAAMPAELRAKLEPSYTQGLIPSMEPTVERALAVEDREVLRIAIAGLQRDPFSPTQIAQIRDLLRSKGQRRLSAYFEGRLKQLQEGAQQ